MKSSDDLNDALDSVKMFNLADECLNRGLDVIEYQIDNVATNNYRLHLIEELEELYKDCVNNYGLFAKLNGIYRTRYIPFFYTMTIQEV